MSNDKPGPDKAEPNKKDTKISSPDELAKKDELMEKDLNSATGGTNPPGATYDKHKDW